MRLIKKFRGSKMAFSKMLILKHIIKKEKSCYSSYCPELDICSQGKTVEEANNNLKEEVALYLDTIEELGTREKIFKERKITLYSIKSKQQKIPVELVAKLNKKDSFITTQAIPCC